MDFNFIFQVHVLLSAFIINIMLFHQVNTKEVLLNNFKLIKLVF